MKFTVTDKLLLAISDGLRKIVLKIGAVGARLDAHVRTKRAIPVGTAVTLTCKCQSKNGDHEGVWYVVEYNLDADDYSLSRDREDRSGTRTYASGGALAPVLS